MAIIVYPLLVSSSISKNIIPGITKTLEKHIMIYDIDRVIADAKSANKKLFRVGKRLSLKEDDDNLPNGYHIKTPAEKSKAGFIDDLRAKAKKEKEEKEAKRKERLAGYGYDDKEWKKTQKEIEDKKKKRIEDKRETEKIGREKRKDAQDEEKYKREKERAVREAASSSVSVGPMDMGTLSLEPTWTKVDIETGGVKQSTLIGIKVTPIIVKSDSELALLMLYDKQLKALEYMAIKVGRSVIKAIIGIWNRFWRKIPIFGSLIAPESTVSGDPRSDIIYSQSIFKNKVFCLINKSELGDEFLKESKNINKLFKLGWKDIIIADDVNRRASFCMRPYKGMCSMLPYQMIYQSVGQSRVYEDLEDLRKSSSSMFKVRKTFTKTISEGIVDNKMNDFKTLKNDNIIEEKKVINEALPKINQLKVIYKNIVDASKKKDISKIQNALNKVNIKPVSDDKLNKMAKKAIPNFNKTYPVAYKIIKNTFPELSDEKTKLSAYAISLKLFRSKDVDKDVKEESKKFVYDVRNEVEKEKKKDKKETPPGIILEKVVGYTVITLVSTASVLFFSVSTIAFGTIPAIILGVLIMIKLLSTMGTKKSVAAPIM